jgi:glycosyltransferase involved in cell wall biosynthesis
MPFFSVVIPLFNKDQLIQDTIKSVLNQSFNDFEIIIVDDGSTDNSFNIVSRFIDPRIKIIKQTNKGVGESRNVGIYESKGKYIALLDADDYWYKDHLLELKKLIDLFPEAGLYCNNYEVLYSKSNCKKARFNFPYDKECIIVKDYFKASIINSVAWTSSVGFSKSKFNTIGGFNTSLKTAQDLDLWIRFALNHTVSFNPKITMTYKLYVENSLSKNEYNLIRYNFINSYRKVEKYNPSLKLYLDINRFAVALRSKIYGEIEIYQKLKNEIDFKNLNLKQKLLIKSPLFLLQLFKQIQDFLIKNNIYISAYS